MIQSGALSRHGSTAAKRTQCWEVGETVQVGFMRLRVLAKVPTPGDYAPDAYALTNAAGDRFYRFVPHKGCERVACLQEAIAS